MSNIDKHALNQEKIEWLNKLADMEYCKSNPGHWLMSLKDTNMLAQLALHSQALLDELEAAEERYEDMLRHARSFREAHDSASELIRKMERNKPTVKLPTTLLWDGKIACYEESEVVAMLERAGINIAAAAKGE